jgi:hypothetical protein
VNENYIGPYVFVFLCIYYSLAANPPFFWVYFFACLLIGGEGGFGFSYLLMGVLVSVFYFAVVPIVVMLSLYSCQMGWLIVFFLWSPLL